MKNLVFVLLLLPAFAFAFQGTPGLEAISTALNTGDVETLSKYFADNVEISIQDKEQIYPKAKASEVLRSFWAPVVVGLVLIAALVWSRRLRFVIPALLVFVLTLFALGSVALAVTSTGPTAIPLRVLPPYLPCFSAGMLLAGAEVNATGDAWWARVVLAVRSLASRPTACFALATGVFTAMVLLLPASTTAPALGLGTERALQSFGQVGVAFLALAPLALATTPATWLEQRTLAAVGAASFGFYLWHIQVLRLLRPMLQGSTATALLGVAIAIIGSYAAGAASARLVEEPARRLLTRRRAPAS